MKKNEEKRAKRLKKAESESWLFIVKLKK